MIAPKKPKEPEIGKTGTKTTTDREINPKTGVETTKTKTEITSTSRTSATYLATMNMNGQIAVRTRGIGAIIPTTPQELTAAICPEAPTAPAITTPTTGDRKTITLDLAEIETALDHPREGDPATPATPAPPDAIDPPPTALAALMAQATAAAAALPNTSTLKR